MQSCVKSSTSGSSQGYCSESSGSGEETTSWTDSSLGTDSPTSFPTRSRPESSLLPPRHPVDGCPPQHTPQLRTPYCSRNGSPQHSMKDPSFWPPRKRGGYGSFNNNRIVRYWPENSSARIERFGVDYHHFPPYRDRSSTGLVDNFREKWHALSSYISQYFRTAGKENDSEAIPLIRKQRFPAGCESEPVRDLGDKFDVDAVKRTDVEEDEYKPPPRWKRDDYLEWLGLLQNTSPADDNDPGENAAPGDWIPRRFLQGRQTSNQRFTTGQAQNKNIKPSTSCLPFGKLLCGVI